MRAIVELNSYAEVQGVDGAAAEFRPLLGAVDVRALPATVVLRAVWRTEPGADDPPGYLPFARLGLSHAEPDGQPGPASMPDIFRAPLERLDGSRILFLAYTLRLQTAGTHRLVFPGAEVEEIGLPVRSHP